MLTDTELKVALQRGALSRSDKIILVLANLVAPSAASAIKAKAKAVGCRMDSWNVATILSRSPGYALSLPNGYELAEKGYARLIELGVSKLSPAAAKVATDLRNHLDALPDSAVKKFIEESILCFESQLFRSAIVMSWLAAIGVLYDAVIAHHLSAFNAEAKRVDAKWKPAINSDDLGRMKESDFLDRIAAISMVGKNVKDELQKALKLRNGCGHPNSLKVGANIAAGHIEFLLLNVFEKF